MTGIPDRNYPAFDAATIALQNRGFAVVNPATIDSDMQLDTKQTWDWYMRHSIRMVLTVGAIALLPGWKTSNGACL